MPLPEQPPANTAALLWVVVIALAGVVGTLALLFYQAQAARLRDRDEQRKEREAGHARERAQAEKHAAAQLSQAERLLSALDRNSDALVALKEAVKGRGR